MARPTAAQMRLIIAILERGGTDVPGSKVFRRFDARTVTIEVCKRQNWVTRTERNGHAFWSVTHRGESDAARAHETAVATAKVRARFKLDPVVGA